MGLFDKLFGKKKAESIPESPKDTPVDSRTPDEIFVENFIKKGGKFLYTTAKEEVLVFLEKILRENTWKSLQCTDNELIELLSDATIPVDDQAPAFFTRCEHLICEDGSILFSSNQLRETKLNLFPSNFIVFATTSQFIHDKDKALTSIKFRFKKEIPSNISAIKDYNPNHKDTNFMYYGNRNTKNLYLILLENL